MFSFIFSDVFVSVLSPLFCSLRFLFVICFAYFPASNAYLKSSFSWHLLQTNAEADCSCFLVTYLPAEFHRCVWNIRAALQEYEHRAAFYKLWVTNGTVYSMNADWLCARDTLMVDRSLTVSAQCCVAVFETFRSYQLTNTPWKLYSAVFLVGQFNISWHLGETETDAVMLAPPILDIFCRIFPTNGTLRGVCGTF